MKYEKLSLPFSSDFPEEWYAMNQGDHFWFGWRSRVLQQLLRDYALPTQTPLRALEIGCGAGFLRNQIEAMTSWDVDGADLNEAALEKTMPSRGLTMLYNIEDQRETLREYYDVIILFDVIEHIDDAGRFLEAALWHLKQDGWIILNVPALQALYSRYDELVGHFRRYDRPSMEKLLKDSPHKLQIMDIRYWGYSLVPIAFLRKIVLRGSRTPQQAVERGFRSPARWMNWLFRALMIAETTLLRRPRCGSSLMALVRKRPA